MKNKPLRYIMRYKVRKIRKKAEKNPCTGSFEYLFGLLNLCQKRFKRIKI